VRQKKDPELNNGTSKEHPDEPSTALADIVTGVTTATTSSNSNSQDRATTSTSMEEDVKPGYRETRAAQDIEENLYVDFSSDDDSLTPGAVHVGGVMNTLDSTRTFSESNIVDEPEQPAADRAMATMPSVLHLVAELVPETDDLQAEIERFREEVKKEREQQENSLVVVAISAEPMVEENNFTNCKRMIYCGIAAFVVIVVAVAVAVGVTSENNNTTPSKPLILSPTDESSSSPSPTISRFDFFLEALLDQNPDLEVSVLTNTGTLQFEALSWLAHEDALNLDPETANGRDILEHFVLAIFYFATDGDNWTKQSQFLQDKSVCEWNGTEWNGIEWNGIEWNGIKCNGSDHVSRHDMGKLVLLFRCFSLCTIINHNNANLIMTFLLSYGRGFWVDRIDPK
jgi:hypothetical protein